MRRIDTSRYDIGNGNTFDVRSSLVAVLFNQKLSPREILRTDELAQRIEAEAGDVLLLEEAEWQAVNRGLELTDLKSHGRDVVEFVRRVLDAPEVQVWEREAPVPGWEAE